MEFLREHLLYLMVNGQSRNAMQEKTQTLLDMSFVRDFCRMVLLECANNYFEQVNSRCSRRNSILSSFRFSSRSLFASFSVISPNTFSNSSGLTGFKI